MPLPVRPAQHRPGESSAPSPTGLATASSAAAAMEPVGVDYAARDPKEVAEHLPVPSAELADRLVDLLMPRYASGVGHSRAS